MRRLPEVLELRERVRLILGLETYGRRADTSTTELRDTLHPDLILAMIDRYLKKNGFNKARNMLRKESNIFTQENAVLAGESIEDDDLIGLIRLGATSDVFEDPYEGKNASSVDPELEAGMYGIITVADLDANIWEEPLTPKTLALATAGKMGYSGSALADATIRAATLNRLVLLLLGDKARDAEFRRVFFGTLHSFTSPPQLMNKFLEYYQKPNNPPPPTSQKIAAATAASTSARDVDSLTSMIRYWFDHHPFDFTHDVKKIVTKFIESHLLRDGHKQAAQKLQSGIPNWESAISHMDGNGGSSSAATAALSTLRESNSGGPVQNRNSSLSSLSTQQPEPKVPKNIFSPTLVIDDVEEEEIARQLTVVDFELYRMVQAAEFLGRRWAVEGGRSAPRLSRLLQRFDRVARWVANQVVTASTVGQKEKKVGKAIARLLKIADYLRVFRNFHSLFAIAAGLRSAAACTFVQAHKKELSKSAQESLTLLEEVFDWTQWHRRYFKDFNATDPPCIPAVPLHLQQICLMEDSSPDKIEEKLINWEKREQLWASLKPLLTAQVLGYNFYKVQQICDLIENAKHDDSESIY
eukprot:TRINITY_DN4253_c0_g1_i2.p1 TRINITY_DN4253_c0_g1~~TRINITY_DN4253_c0_g1_i2.p1  ORF type:complete len:584 (-),score=110.29 TRINITY_DN4253_c0_g1_i2:150-1901(-)